MTDWLTGYHTCLWSIYQKNGLLPNMLFDSMQEWDTLYIYFCLNVKDVYTVFQCKHIRSHMVHVTSQFSAPATTSNSSRDFEQRSGLVRNKIISCTHRNLAWKKLNPLKQLDAYQREFEELEWDKMGEQINSCISCSSSSFTTLLPSFSISAVLSFFSQRYLIRHDSIASKLLPANDVFTLICVI